VAWWWFNGKLIIQNGSERHIERALLAGITVHFTAFAGLKMAHASAPANDLSVLCDLYPLSYALGRHFSKKSRMAQ
jgi:hypothetical protein